MELPRLKITLLVFFSNILLSYQTFQETKFTVIHKWKTVELEFVDEKTNKEIQPINIAIVDADFHPAISTGRIFVTSPQMARPGNPATLYEVIAGLLKPFPIWPSKNSDNTTSCEGAFSVYRITIDECGRLWVLDSGKVGSKVFCKPKLLIYDLNKWDRLMLRYEFPSAVITERSSLSNIITESYQKNCSDSTAYIADMHDHGLIMFDLLTKTSWRIQSSFFYPYPSEAYVTIQDQSFELMSGLLGLALSPPDDHDRKLYFHSYSSVREAWIPVNALKNRSAVVDPLFLRRNIVESPGTRAGQSTVEVMTDDGILIYVLITKNSLACWNSKMPFTIENQHILQKDDVNFQFISGLKLKDNKLLITSNRLQNYYTGKIDPDDYNYRVMLVEDVNRLLQNTPCRPSSNLGNKNSGKNHVSSGHNADQHRESREKNHEANGDVNSIA